MTAATMALNSRVLVLNKNWVPVNVMSVLGAIHKVWNERAKFVEFVPPETYLTYDFEEWVMNWEDAIHCAKVAENRVMSGAGCSFVSPEIIVCTHYNGFMPRAVHQRPKFSRANIYRRDRNTCQMCGKKFKVAELTLDHVIPKSQGGQMVWTNIVLACVSCNQRKGDRTLKQAGMRLIRQPTCPKAQDVAITPIERLRRKIGDRAPKTWEHFLSKMFWNVELVD